MLAAGLPHKSWEKVFLKKTNWGGYCLNFGHVWLSLLVARQVWILAFIIKIKSWFNWNVSFQYLLSVVVPGVPHFLTFFFFIIIFVFYISFIRRRRWFFACLPTTNIISIISDSTLWSSFRRPCYHRPFYIFNSWLLTCDNTPWENPSNDHGQVVVLCTLEPPVGEQHSCRREEVKKCAS